MSAGEGRKRTYTSLDKLKNNTEGSAESALNISKSLLTKLTTTVILENQTMTEDKALETVLLNQGDCFIYLRLEEWTNPRGINGYEHYADRVNAFVSVYSIIHKYLIDISRLSLFLCSYTLNNIPLNTGSTEKLYKKAFS